MQQHTERDSLHLRQEILELLGASVIWMERLEASDLSLGAMVLEVEQGLFSSSVTMKNMEFHPSS